MRYILSRAGSAILEQYAWSKTLLAFDFDGTLAPIVADPESAILREATGALLQKAAKLYPCVIISGRAQKDVVRSLRNIRLCNVIGNHGAEPNGKDSQQPCRQESRFVAVIRKWRAILEERLIRFKGIRIEDKTYSITVHYRYSREKKKARAEILRAVSDFNNVRVIGGKQVVNLLPDGAPHKGIALEQERSRLLCDTAIYVGDDETDEDVFAMDQPGQLLSIRVGASRKSFAQYFIRSQIEIDELLSRLVNFRGDYLRTFE
ncbi:MAG: trehalose-phosphatase [Pseudomonadota bacterium]